MRIINDVEFSADDINEYKNIIYMNIIKGKQDSIILSAKSILRQSRKPLFFFFYSLYRSSGPRCWQEATKHSTCRFSARSRREQANIV